MVRRRSANPILFFWPIHTKIIPLNSEILTTGHSSGNGMEFGPKSFVEKTRHSFGLGERSSLPSSSPMSPPLRLTYPMARCWMGNFWPGILKALAHSRSTSYNGDWVEKRWAKNYSPRSLWSCWGLIYWSGKAMTCGKRLSRQDSSF